MMRHIVSINVSHDGFDCNRVVGEGDTEAEAIERCMAQVRDYLSCGIKLAEGLVLPAKAAAKVPSVPAGHGLLILERSSHSDGSAYDWRFFAVSHGSHELSCEGSDWTWPFAMDASPVRYAFMDSNSDYEFTLPNGSKEFVDGVWVPRTAAQYSY